MINLTFEKGYERVLHPMSSSKLLEIKSNKAIPKSYEPIIDESVMFRRECSEPSKNCKHAIEEHTTIEIDRLQPSIIGIEDSSRSDVNMTPMTPNILSPHA